MLCVASSNVLNTFVFRHSFKQQRVGKHFYEEKTPYYHWIP